MALPETCRGCTLAERYSRFSNVGGCTLSDKSRLSLAIAGFLYQFIHNIDRVLTAYRTSTLSHGVLALVLELPGADTIYRGMTTEFVPCKARRGRAWSPFQIPLEILPPLVKAVLGCDTLELHYYEFSFRLETSFVTRSIYG